MNPRLARFAVVLLIGLARDVAAQPVGVRSTTTLPGMHEVTIGLAPRRDLLSNALGAGRVQHPRAETKVDLGPLVDDITGFLNRHGIPLRHDPELSGDDGIVFSASVRINNDLPAVQLHIGDHGPFDAFYSEGSGFRWSLIWPMAATRQFALQLGGGDDGDFGNWAIVGLQWHHPRRPLAIGIGMPVALSDAKGPVGVVCQIRMVLP